MFSRRASSMSARVRRAVLWPLSGLVAATVGLSACASGPADFADLSRPAADPAAEIVKSEPQQAALAEELAAAGTRQASAGKAGDNGLSSAMALAVIRQQQMEEARKLLDGVSSFPEPPVAAAPECDPTVDPACPPVATAPAQ